MSKIIKDGPQLTGAQALDAILAKLDALTSVNPTGFGFTAGQYAGFQFIKDYVSVIRAEKFDDPPTDNPWEALGKSRSYRL